MCHYELHEYHGCHHMCQAKPTPCRATIVRGFWCQLKRNWKFAGYAWGEGECWKCAGTCPQKLLGLNIPTERAWEDEQDRVARMQAMLLAMTHNERAADSGQDVEED